MKRVDEITFIAHLKSNFGRDKGQLSHSSIEFEQVL